ncbi:hypothetical protein MMC10_006207 [Thelotrema lepadinum]|nr:hypothetical protein [Thelotrema lepadinum]
MPNANSRRSFPEIDNDLTGYRYSSIKDDLEGFHKIFVTPDGSRPLPGFEQVEAIQRRRYRHEWGFDRGLLLKIGGTFYWWNMKSWQGPRNKELWSCKDETLETVLEKAKDWFHGRSIGKNPGTVLLLQVRER